MERAAQGRAGAAVSGGAQVTTGGGPQCRALGDKVGVGLEAELDPEGLFHPS